MDVLIPIKDTCTDFTELRFALRSLDKHMSGIRKVFVASACEGLTNQFPGLVQIRIKDVHKDPALKEKNIFWKILGAMATPRMTNNILFTNDDIFLLQDFDADAFPFFNRCTLQEGIAKRDQEDHYTRAMVRTCDVLTERNFQTKHFDVHTPIVYRADRFQDLMLEYDWGPGFGYLIKSLYANTNKLDGPHFDDVKFKWPASSTAIRRRILGQPMFSIDEAALNDHMLAVLLDLYPEPSRWER